MLPAKWRSYAKRCLSGGGEEGAGADSADAARRRSHRLLLHRVEIISLLPLPLFLSFFSSTVVHSPFLLNLFPCDYVAFYAPCVSPFHLLHLSAYFQDVRLIRLLPFVLSIYLRVVYNRTFLLRSP